MIYCNYSVTIIVIKFFSSLNAIKSEYKFFFKLKEI